MARRLTNSRPLRVALRVALAASSLLGCSEQGTDAGGPDVGSPTGSCGALLRSGALIATGAEIEPLPDDSGALVTSAGSLEVAFDGAHGFTKADVDPPYSAAVTTLRNGQGGVVEQHQLNRGLPGGDGCSSGKTGYPTCWLFAPDDVVDGVLESTLPEQCSSANAGADSSGQRVEVSGTVTLDYTAAPFTDNSHERFRFTWSVPDGRSLDETRLDLRLRTDAAGDGLGEEDPLLPALRLRWPNNGPDRIVAPLRIEEKTAARLTVSGNVQEIMDFMCSYTPPDACEVTASQVEVTGAELTVAVTNTGAEPAVLSDLFTQWPAGNGALAEVRVDGVTIWEKGQPPPVLSTLGALAPDSAPRTIAAGRTATLRLRFSAPSISNDLDAYALLVRLDDGCIAEP